MADNEKYFHVKAQLHDIYDPREEMWDKVKTVYLLAAHMILEHPDIRESEIFDSIDEALTLSRELFENQYREYEASLEQNEDD